MEKHSQTRGKKCHWRSSKYIWSNTALLVLYANLASCYICLSPTLFLLYFPYSTCGSTLTNANLKMQVNTLTQHLKLFKSTSLKPFVEQTFTCCQLFFIHHATCVALLTPQFTIVNPLTYGCTYLNGSLCNKTDTYWYDEVLSQIQCTVLAVKTLANQFFAKSFDCSLLHFTICCVV